MIRQIAEATGSGTAAYGVDVEGALYERGYGERHGRTFGGAGCVVISHGPWKLACAEAWDWEAIGRRCALPSYLAARGRGLDHEAALLSAERLSGSDPACSEAEAT